MSGSASGCWVGVSAREGLVERSRSTRGAEASVFDTEPLVVETLPAGTRRVCPTAVRRCLELLAPVVGPTYAHVDLLLVFAGTFTTAWAHRLVDTVEGGTARVRPTDSTNMEGSEAIRAALAALDRGRPRSALVIASAFDAGLAASLCAGCASALVICLDVYGPDPEDCDVLAAHLVLASVEGERHD